MYYHAPRLFLFRETEFSRIEQRICTMFKEGLLICGIGLAGTHLFLFLMVLVMRAMEKVFARFGGSPDGQTGGKR